MDYKEYIKEITNLFPDDSVKKINEIELPKANNVIQDIQNSITEEFNLSERVVYDRHAQKPELSPKMVEMVKRQVKGMNGYTLSRVYETKGSYRMVFESEQNGNFEITIREK